MEYWKKITDWDYEISNLGRVRRITGRTAGTILKGQVSNSGYKTVFLWNHCRFKNITIHRFVCKMFNPNLENKPQVNHINGNKLDNRAKNLEWVTNKENCQKFRESPLYKKWTPSDETRLKMSKLTKQRWADGRFTRKYTKPVYTAKARQKIREACFRRWAKIKNKV